MEDETVGVIVGLKLAETMDRDDAAAVRKQPSLRSAGSKEKKRLEQRLE